MPEWVHQRAEHLLAKNPNMPKGMAFALATQQGEAVGKTPKGFGTPEGHATAKAKYDSPSDDKKTANPGHLDSPKLAADKVYEKTTFQGIPIHIDRPKGFVQPFDGKTVGGKTLKPWKRVYKTDYGFIPGTKAGDGEELDVYLGPNKTAPNAYVIKQMINGKEDEKKVMLGFRDEAAARAMFLAHSSPAFRKTVIGGIAEVPMDDFKKMLPKTASAIDIMDLPHVGPRPDVPSPVKSVLTHMVLPAAVLGGGAMLGAAAAVGPRGREQMNNEIHDPRLYSNMRGIFESAEDRVKAHKLLDRRKDHSILSAMHEGFTRGGGKTASASMLRELQKLADKLDDRMLLDTMSQFHELPEHQFQQIHHLAAKYPGMTPTNAFQLLRARGDIDSQLAKSPDMHDFKPRAQPLPRVMPDLDKTMDIVNEVDSTGQKILDQTAASRTAQATPWATKAVGTGAPKVPSGPVPLSLPQAPSVPVGSVPQFGHPPPPPLPAAASGAGTLGTAKTMAAPVANPAAFAKTMPSAVAHPPPAVMPKINAPGAGTWTNRVVKPISGAMQAAKAPLQNAFRAMGGLFKRASEEEQLVMMQAFSDELAKMAGLGIPAQRLVKGFAGGSIAQIAKPTGFGKAIAGATNTTRRPI